MGGQPQRKDQKVRGPPAEGVEDVVAVFDTPVAQSDIICLQSSAQLVWPFSSEKPIRIVSHLGDHRRCQDSPPRADNWGVLLECVGSALRPTQGLSDSQHQDSTGHPLPATPQKALPSWSSRWLFLLFGSERALFLPPPPHTPREKLVSTRILGDARDPWSVNLEA